MKNIGLLKKIPFVLAIAMLVSVLSFASYAAPRQKCNTRCDND